MCLMVPGTGIHGHFLESTAVVDIGFQLGKVSIELGNAGGLKGGGNVLEIIIWQRVFFVVSNGYNSLSDAEQQPGNFINIFSFVVVFDAVAKHSVHKGSLIGIAGKNKVVK